MKAYASVRERYTPLAARRAAGDAAVIVGIVLLGVLDHGGNPLSAPVETALTVLPFLLGWVVVAGLLGIYGDPAGGAVRSVRTGVGTWFGAANVGLILRASPAFPGGITWPFPLVITGFAALGLVAWRVVDAALLPAGGDDPEEP